jgi:2-(1,2-epoxy-1,2-dihydrophenyl)acetyl-CoA isomerase
MVTVELTGQVAWITLSSPETGNSLSMESVAALDAAVRTARRADVGVVVLRAAGPTFSVGGDLRAFASAEDPEAYLDDLAEALHRVVSELVRMDAVVVSSVQGTTAGAGVALAAAADVVLAAESARFTLAYTKVGLSPDGGSSLLTASIGLHRALYLALADPVVTAAEAQAMGLVAEVHPDASLDAAVAALVDRLAHGSRAAQVAAKHLFRGRAVGDPESAMRLESLSIRAAGSGPDGREGIAAFLAKRRPSFPSSATGSPPAALDTGP